MNSLVPVVIVTIVNIIGWVAMRVFALGRLDGAVKSLNETCDRHERLLNNGIVQQISDLKLRVGELTGRVNTYIELTKGKSSKE
jgi:hypothetical protein